MLSHRGTGGSARLTNSVDQGRRRSLTVVVTLVVGSVLLAATLRAPSGSTTFFVIGFLVAGTWISGIVDLGASPAQSDPIVPAGSCAQRTGARRCRFLGVSRGLSPRPTSSAHLDRSSHGPHQGRCGSDGVGLGSRAAEWIRGRALLPRRSIRLLGIPQTRSRLSRRLCSGDRDHGERCAHRCGSCHGKHLHTATRTLWRDLGFDNDAPLLDNPHGSRISEMMTTGNGHKDRSAVVGRRCSR